MDKKDYKYILRRVITYFIIFFIILFFKSCNVHAETYNPINNGTIGALYQPNGTQNISLGQNYTLQSGQGITQIYFKFDTGMVDDGYGGSIQSTLYAGSYLFDFYVVSSNLDNNLTNCKDLNTDYRFVDLTTGNTVSSSSSIKSQCVNSFYTYIDGVQAIHYLVKFTITNTQSYDYMTQRLLFINNLWHGVGFTQSGATYNITIGNIYDFDSTIVNQFNNAADNGTIISQNNDIISRENIIIEAIDGVIARQNQAHTDAENTQNAINNASSQAHQDSQDIKNAMTDTSSPSNLNGLSQSAGWLPPGPVDSILNLPLSLLNNISDNLSKSCQPVVLTIPYVNSTLTLPCLNTLYDQMGVGPLLSFIGTIASCFILLSYLIKLYKWVDDTLTFRENNQIDNWGGI